jgi:hypothetical protein
MGSAECDQFASKACTLGAKAVPDMPRSGMAGVTGLEPATSGVTGRRSNQLSYTPEASAPRRRQILFCPGECQSAYAKLLRISPRRERQMIASTMK